MPLIKILLITSRDEGFLNSKNRCHCSKMTGLFCDGFNETFKSKSELLLDALCVSFFNDEKLIEWVCSCFCYLHSTTFYKG